MQSDVALLTLKELSEEMKIDVKTMRKEFIYQSDFPYTLVGKTRRYRIKEVSAWLDKHQHYA